MEERILKAEVWLRSVRHIAVFPRYRKALEVDERKQTHFGALLTIVTLLALGTLFYFELSYYYNVETVSDVEVDDEMHGLIPLFLNVSFPYDSCSHINVVLADINGVHSNVPSNPDQNEIVKNDILFESISNFTITPRGPGKASDCGSCYGAESPIFPCCNSCSEVILSYLFRGWNPSNQSNFEQCGTHLAIDDLSAGKTGDAAEKPNQSQGCNIVVQAMLNRVPGTIHFIKSRGSSPFFIVGDQNTDNQGLNANHILHAVFFGDAEIALNFPSSLKGYRALHHPIDSTHNYFVTVVPTLFNGINGTVLEAFQYSVWSHVQTKPPSDDTTDVKIFYGMPMTSEPTGSLVFHYETAPIRVHFVQKYPFRSFLHFIMSVMSVAGGVFTVMAFFDSFVYRSVEEIKKRIGKQE